MASKKLGKLLAFTAIAGAVAAGIAYFKHKNISEFFDDDLDDFDDDFDDEDFDFPLPTENDKNSVKREYVSLNLDKENSSEESESNEEPAKETKISDADTKEEVNTQETDTAKSV